MRQPKFDARMHSAKEVVRLDIDIAAFHKLLKQWEGITANTPNATVPATDFVDLLHIVKGLVTYVQEYQPTRT